MDSAARSPSSVSWAPWSVNDIKSDVGKADGSFPRNVAYIDNLKLDPDLQPTTYQLAGTHPASAILFTNVKILDSTGREPYSGDVLIRGSSSLS